MTRYAIRSKPRAADCGWYDDAPMLPALTVYETRDDAEYTGLLDKDGHEIVRLREPMGFIRRD
jgi:hypothetical protein